jgi:elongation factor P
MATTYDLKNGQVLDLEGELWSVLQFQHVKPGKGDAFARTTLRNVRSGAVVDRSFTAGAELDTAAVERRSARLSRADGDGFVFQQAGGDREIRVPAAMVADAARYLTPGTEVIVVAYRDEVLAVRLPTSVVLTVASVGEPGSATAVARTHSGVEVLVPAAVAAGERIRVDTRDGNYLGLA